MPFAQPITLRGLHASLEPLSLDHESQAILAAQDGELWKLWYTSVPSPQEMKADIKRRLGLQKKGAMLPFAVRDASGTLVGMTSYMNIDAQNHRVEIGSTWYAHRAQRTALNTDCKLMLLTHAFDTLGCIAVEFRTHRLNAQSRQAIERLGAQLDGILRHHQRTPDGLLRDTCVYSITAPEWPAVNAHLCWLLSLANDTSNLRILRHKSATQ